MHALDILYIDYYYNYNKCQSMNIMMKFRGGVGGRTAHSDQWVQEP